MSLISSAAAAAAAAVLSVRSDSPQSLVDSADVDSAGERTHVFFFFAGPSLVRLTVITAAINCDYQR